MLLRTQDADATRGTATLAPAARFTARGVPINGVARVRKAIAVAALLAGTTLAATPAAAQGMAGTVPGRVGGSMAALVALAGVVSGGLALRRARQATTAGPRGGRGHPRDGAMVALALGLVGVLLAAVHLATSTGGVGTGSGKAGAVVGAVLGLTAVALGRSALARAGRAPDA